MDALLEERLGRAYSLVKRFVNVDLYDVTSLGAHNCESVSRINDCAGKHTLDGAKINILVLDLLVNEVTRPKAHAIVMNGHQTRLSVIEE